MYEITTFKKFLWQNTHLFERNGIRHTRAYNTRNTDNISQDNVSKDSKFMHYEYFKLYSLEFITSTELINVAISTSHPRSR